jgi:hypothetical protein
LQASILDGSSFDPFAIFDDSAGPAEVGIGGGDILEALMEALMVVIIDEGLDLDSVLL